MEHYGYIVLCYVLGSVLAASFAGFAFAYGWWWTKRRSHNRNTEDFITARATQSFWRIGWSFYAGAVGSWVIVTPSQFAEFSGIVGIIVYAITAGLPVLLIALCGGRITRELPHVLSLSDFVGWRFGPIAKSMVFLITAFIQCLFLLAEFTTIGTIFADFVGSVSWGIIVIIGVLTLTYTAYGGLAVSIATDQFQGMASMSLAIVMVAYVAATYRTPLPSPLPPNLGPNEAGYTSILTLTCSLVASSTLNEAFWQRVWASENRTALYRGAALGFSTITLIVFLSGFGGWLAFAGGYITPGVTNPNLYLMQILGGSPGGGPKLVSNWVGVLVVLLAIVMNEGAVDSLQNGLAASISGTYLKNAPLLWTRVAVVAINVPLVVIATRGYSVLALFLIGNLLSTCAIVPLLLGMVPALRRTLGETAFVFGTLGGVLGVTATGIAVRWVPGQLALSFSDGAYWAWYGNPYDWRVFLAALLASTATLVAWQLVAAAAAAVGVRGPGLSGLLMRLPGMRTLTATPEWSPDWVPAQLPERSSSAGKLAQQQQLQGNAAATAAGSSNVVPVIVTQASK